MLRSRGVRRLSSNAGGGWVSRSATLRPLPELSGIPSREAQVEALGVTANILNF